MSLMYVVNGLQIFQRATGDIVVNGYIAQIPNPDPTSPPGTFLSGASVGLSVVQGSNVNHLKPAQSNGVSTNGDGYFEWNLGQPSGKGQHTYMAQINSVSLAGYTLAPDQILQRTMTISV